jgi:nitrate/nitrite transporter NarK
VPLGNDLATYTTGGGAPTIIADLGNLGSAIYSTVTGRPVATTVQVVPAQQPAPLGGLLPLLVLGLVVWLIVKK